MAGAGPNSSGNSGGARRTRCPTGSRMAQRSKPRSCLWSQRVAPRLPGVGPHPRHRRSPGRERQGDAGAAGACDRQHHTRHRWAPVPVRDGHPGGPPGVAPRRGHGAAGTDPARTHRQPPEGNRRWMTLFSWRRLRGSNPRGSCPPTRFPGVCLRPLGQASAGQSSQPQDPRPPVAAARMGSEPMDAFCHVTDGQGMWTRSPTTRYATRGTLPPPRRARPASRRATAARPARRAAAAVPPPGSPGQSADGTPQTGRAGSATGQREAYSLPRGSNRAIRRTLSSFGSRSPAS